MDGNIAFGLNLLLPTAFENDRPRTMNLFSVYNRNISGNRFYIIMSTEISQFLPRRRLLILNGDVLTNSAGLAFMIASLHIDFRIIDSVAINVSISGTDNLLYHEDHQSSP